MKDKETMVNIGEIHLESDPSSGRVVVLKEKGGAERRLTMWVGDSEFAAIAKEKGLIAPKRPLTHDLYLQVIEKFQAEFLRVEICELREDTYYAKVIFCANGVEHAVDCRPSDGVALALNRKIPIMINESLLHRELDQETIRAYEKFVWRVSY